MSAFTQQQRLQSFIDKVLVDDGCWEWLASRQPTGYGQFRAKGTMDLAHRNIKSGASWSRVMV